MEGCRRLSNSRPEIDGLDDLLMAPEQHAHDAAIERERRRSRQGYATPADARAFLQMARQPRLECGPVPANAFLVDHDLVMAFEAGWSMLYRDVSLFVADQLVSTLADLHCVDADIHRDLRALRLELEKQREAGTPWLARDAADALAMLDMTAWISVLGLLDECPILPAALTAVLERRTTSVSPTAFEFISTTAQIGDIRLFMGTLPAVLSG